MTRKEKIIENKILRDLEAEMECEKAIMEAVYIFEDKVKATIKEMEILETTLVNGWKERYIRLTYTN